MKDPVDKYFKTTKINKLTSCFFISCIVLFTMLLIVGVGHIYLDDLLEFIHLIRYSEYRDLEYYSYPYTDKKTEIKWEIVEVYKEGKLVFRGLFGCGSVFCEENTGVYKTGRSLVDRITVWKYAKNSDESSAVLLPLKDGPIYWRVNPDGSEDKCFQVECREAWHDNPVRQK